MEINKSTKRQIFESLLPEIVNLTSRSDRNVTIITFLSLIWPLRDMPSTDARFNTAYDDAWQHLINNDDWEYPYVFLDRFKLLEDSETFYRFLEAIVSPEIVPSIEDITSLKKKINPLIKPFEVKLSVVSYFEELPVNKIRPLLDNIELPNYLRENAIPFYTQSTPNRKHSYFELRYNKWDDYGHKTQLSLYYFDKGYYEKIGAVKILKKDTRETWDDLPTEFYQLGTDFCSLGQEELYYTRLKAILPKDYMSVLFALKDVAVFPKISERFEQVDGFKDSLLRFNEAEVMWRTIRYKLAGIDLEERFKFSFAYQLPYCSNKLLLNFDFEYGQAMEHRIYALIGKNGSGKTMILNSLANKFSENDDSDFAPRKPIYGKILSVSYSAFDKAPIPESDAAFNYVYCGLKKPDGTIMNDQELFERFGISVSLIRYKKSVSQWYQMLGQFLPNQFLHQIFEGNAGWPEFVDSTFDKIKSQLSSGQSIVLFIITELIAHIRNESLILYDEPETHLHPNAITDLMNTLFKLLEQFDSFCIIATHSPLIVQEIPSRNVFIIERDEDLAILKRLEKESFAENLTVITNDIFGNRDTQRHYLKLIRQIVQQNQSFEQVISMLSSNDVPVNLNTRLYIRSLLEESNEKS